MVRVRNRWILGTWLGLWSVSPVLAQPPRQGPAEAVLVVTVASRFEQGANEAPASVTVITAHEIARHGWRTLAEVHQSVRGGPRLQDNIGCRERSRRPRAFRTC